MNATAHNLHKSNGHAAAVDPELGVLASILLNPSAFADVAKLVKQTSFRTDENRGIWLHIKGLAAESRPINEATLIDSLESGGDLDAVGGREYVARIVGAVPDGERAVYFAELLCRETNGKPSSATPAKSKPPRQPRAQRQQRQSTGDKRKAAKADPALEAAAFLSLTKIDGVQRTRFWRGEFYRWADGRYRAIHATEVRSLVVTTLNERYSFVTTGVVNNVMDQLRAQAMLPAQTEVPSWIEASEFAGWDPSDMIAARNGLVYVPAVADGENCLCPATPNFLCTSALDYDFTPNVSKPELWLRFLNQIWPNDVESIETFQEWMGYCLTPDTRQQKILLLVGPRRSGKGTIARVMSAVIGHDNVAGPTLSGLATNFGLWPLLNKSVAIIADARLSGRTDQAIVVERLLSISGEDSTMVDRKCLEPINAKLPTRLMILTNELPRLGDSSGALAGRFIVLKLSQSFFGREDITLSDALIAERAGILHWAIEGWKRLRERGSFRQPAEGAELCEQLEEIASPVGEFVKECCNLDTTLKIPVQDLYCGWCWWCNQKGRQPGIEQIFGRDLTAALPQVKRSQPRDAKRGRYRAYDGIDMTPEMWATLTQAGALARSGTHSNGENAQVSEF